MRCFQLAVALILAVNAVQAISKENLAAKAFKAAKEEIDREIRNEKNIKHRSAKAEAREAEAPKGCMRHLVTEE